MTRQWELLTQALELTPLPLEPRWRRAEGRWRDAKVVLETAAARGETVRYARVATVRGAALEIDNLVALAHGGAVLAFERVSLGKPQTLFVADVSAPPEVPRVAVPASRFPAAGALPPFCARFFSAAPLFAQVPGGRRDEAWQEVETRVDAFIRSTRAPRGSDDVRDWQQAYVDAHREEDRGLRMLGTLFGAQWASAFVAEVLFPVRCPGG